MIGEIEMTDNRSAPRTNVKFTALCERDGKATECEIIDISPQGLGIRVNILLVPGDIALIKIGDQHLPTKVVRANGNIFGLWFRDLSDKQLEYVKWLCRKDGNNDTRYHEQEKAPGGETKIYSMKASSDKEIGLLGLFISSLKKNCNGFIKAETLA